MLNPLDIFLYIHIFSSKNIQEFMSTSKTNNDDVYVNFEILHRLYKLSCQFGC